MFSYTVVGNWLFLMGSLLFTFDAINNTWVSCSMRSFLILAACCFFTIGCILFLLDNSAKADSQQQVGSNLNHRQFEEEQARQEVWQELFAN